MKGHKEEMLKEKEIAAHNKKAEIEQLTATFKQ